jgi:hypothetical protein
LISLDDCGVKSTMLVLESFMIVRQQILNILKWELGTKCIRVSLLILTISLSEIIGNMNNLHVDTDNITQ